MEAEEKIITPLSKSDKKRIAQEKRDKKKEGIIRTRMAETQFFIQDGKRFVRPYYHDHKLHAKARWYGFTLEHLFLVEFSVSREYFEKALARGDISVNGTTRDPNHQIKHEDVIHHKLHRHEPTVLNSPIKIVADTPDVLAIDKPSSIPIHPSGSYRHNTILDILATEYGYTSKIYPVHRIDRLTSGLLLIARGPDVAKKMGANMMSEKVEKQYLARVHGEFPSEVVVCEEPIGPWPGRRGLQRIATDGKSAHTTFKKIKSFPDNTSLVLCTLKTGRTHQIRVHLKGLGYPIANDPAYGPTSPPFDYKPPNAAQNSQADEFDCEEDIYETPSSPASPSPIPSSLSISSTLSPAPSTFYHPVIPRK
eukprot:Phypoly_transcript_08677.p1 GENE.Phypoly_transcript_08677~~Phypoly_transcript_08677.p1  ORF type:complete len:365 (+),score=49.60 Phypoly_transcript_08677:135-1229(+)